MNSLKYIVCGLLALAFMAIACERRPLEVIVEERVQVRIVVDWRFNNFASSEAGMRYAFTADSAYIDSAANRYYGGEPSGITLMLWGQTTGERIYQTVNGHIAPVSLRPDTYQLIVFSNTEDEYSQYMSLYDRTSFNDITMRLHHYASRTDGQDYIWYPDPVGVAVDTFEVSRDMVAQDTTIFVRYEDFIDGNYDRQAQGGRYYEIPEHAIPMTVTLYLQAKVKNRASLKHIEASISGMADGFYLAHINRTRETGTIELDPKGWEFRAYGAEADSLGFIVNKTATFGLPYGKELLSERDSADNVLSFRITLTNDSVQTCSFRVGKNMLYLKPDGSEAQVRRRQDLHDLRLEVDLTDVIVLPPVEGKKTGAGFDAEVVDWEYGGTFDVEGF